MVVPTVMRARIIKMFGLKRLWGWVMIVGLVAVFAMKKIMPWKKVPPVTWQPPDSCDIPPGAEGDLIRYGENLVASTSRYLGPRGTIAALSNGMNCQNCHLEAGTRLYGNNYSAVFSTYPKFRERSGTVENIYKRVNDCIERSLNGKGLDTGSREMQAFSAYINWLGHHVPKNSKPAGAGIRDLPFLARAADPEKGHALYWEKCQRCHGPPGEGVPAAAGVVLTHPPLWGRHTHTTAASSIPFSPV